LRAPSGNDTILAFETSARKKQMRLFFSALLTASVGVFAAVAQERAQSNKIDLSSPDGALSAMRRIWCGDADGQPVYWNWRGEAFARRQGERDRLLFKVEGLNTRACVAADDPKRGRGFRMVSRELLLYLDPTTGKPLTRWTNPYTNETVDVVHVANDPVNGEHFPLGKDGEPLAWRGHSIADNWFLTSTIPLFYQNPLGGDYQAEVGGTYHASEMFNFMGDLASLTEQESRSAKVLVGWVRMSDWLPWMKMNGREGLVYMHTAGRKLSNWEEVSPLMRDEVAAHYPLYRNPPPLDDKRPNVTSWSYYRGLREAAPSGKK
jgi:hypothetical protein